jgi:hypothetical protein
MNERIKELAEQAGWRYVLGGNPRTLIEDRDYFVTNEQAEKFAELIVRECINVSENHAKYLESEPKDKTLAMYEDGIVNGIYEATECIKEHFGIKEI